MQQKTINIYKFDELSEEVQEKVIQDNYHINVDHEWWEYIYEDAENVGLRISSFDIDRGSIDISSGKYLTEVIDLILDNHGKDTDTYLLADQYNNELECLKWPCIEAAEVAFLKDIGECYLSMLRKEYEWLTSEEMIKETIEANEYDFDESGRMI